MGRSAEAAAALIRPISEPRRLDNVYEEQDFRRVLAAVRQNAPWPTTLGLYFKTTEELIATTSGIIPDGELPPLENYVSATFKARIAEDGVCLFPEIEDVFYSHKFLELARSYWGAKYAQPTVMICNLQGPSKGGESAHLDAVSFRGITQHNTPLWLMNMMGKSGLFHRWMEKKAQVIAWFYKSDIGGGFTYWPDGPLAAPKHLSSPMWNDGILVQNEMMYHRGESNGPEELRKPKGLATRSVIVPDASDPDGWCITTDGEVIQHIAPQNMRYLLHWSANVYMDMEELKLALNHQDDLSHERVFDMFAADLKAQGYTVKLGDDPLNDRDFIRLLTQAYDIGAPSGAPEVMAA